MSHPTVATCNQLNHLLLDLPVRLELRLVALRRLLELLRVLADTRLDRRVRELVLPAELLLVQTLRRGETLLVLGAQRIETLLEKGALVGHLCRGGVVGGELGGESGGVVRGSVGLAHAILLSRFSFLLHGREGLRRGGGRQIGRSGGGGAVLPVCLALLAHTLYI